MTGLACCNRWSTSGSTKTTKEVQTVKKKDATSMRGALEYLDSKKRLSM